MIVYIVLIILIVLSYITINSMSFEENTKKRVFLIFSGLLLVLLAALRHKSVGTDTAGYLADYEAERYATIKEVFTEWGENQAYYWLSGIFSRNHIPVQFWFGFLGIVSTGPIFYLIYKYSENHLFSVLLYLSIGTYYFTLAGLKQTVAIGLLALAFVQVVNKKPIKFTLLVLLATFFHQTALLFLIVYPLAKIKSLKVQTVMYSAMTILAFCNAVPIIQSVLSVLDNDHYEQYLKEQSKYSLVSFSIQLLMLLVCLIYSSNYKIELHTKATLFTMVFLGIAMQAYASSFATMFRLSLYFNIGPIILMPSCLRQEPNSNYRKFLEFAAMTVFVAYYLYSMSQGSGYRFFWQ